MEWAPTVEYSNRSVWCYYLPHFISHNLNNFRSKKDRKEQKSNFRDFVKTIEDGDTFYEKMVIYKWN